MKQKTIDKYNNIINAAKKENKSLKRYCEENGISYNSVNSFITKQRKSENKSEIEIIREGNKIVEYKVTVYRRDKSPFTTILSREDTETLWGLYTYYGGNVTARNVANEFPKFTLPEVKYLFRAFGITKDSIWAPQHLVEELTLEELNQYRMNLKERAAFKYADAQQERDFKNTLNKMASEINKLNDRNEFIKDLIFSDIQYKEYSIKDVNNIKGTTGIIVLSDIHCGAYNTPNGYLSLPEYNENEIENRLNNILDLVYLKQKNWNNIIILNLGDSIDNYRGTTAKGTPLPTNMNEQQSVQIYLRVMNNFFNNLIKLFREEQIKYICIGDSNHDSKYGWLANVALESKLSSMNIKSYVSNNPIDNFNIGDYTITYLHGHDGSTQYKGFPLILDKKTESWFNNYFLQANYNFKKNRIVVKGDLHQYAINSCNTFDYINAPSLYGSSSYIVSNFGKGKSGTLYLEVENDKYTSGVIWN